MKHFVLFIIFVFLFFVFIGIKSKSNHISDIGNNLSNLQVSFPSTLISHNHAQKHCNNEDLRIPDQNQYYQAIENIKSEEYNLFYSEGLKSFQSPNRANNIRFIYHKDGFTARSRENKIPLFDLNDKTTKVKEKNYKMIPEWSVRFKTLGIKRESGHKAFESSGGLMKIGANPSVERENNSFEFAGSDVKADKNRAFTEDENIRIDYNNTEKGMIQDFLIKNRLNGDGKLKLILSASTNLRITLEKDALKFKDKTGSEKMKYSSLKVWDAAGKELRAGFEKESNIENEKTEKQILNQEFQAPKQQEFCIIVNDEDAIYPITIDPLSSSPSWTAECNQSDAAFGYSVSTAGDVNGDGFSDVIIGAFLYDNGQTDEGKVFLYYGSPLGLLPVAIWTAEGNQASAQFGYSVACAGDVNGDGYSDVIVGANSYDNALSDEGKAFVYYGSILGLSSTPNWTAVSNQAGSQFGWSISTAGDVNNDGYSDIIVGAPLFNGGETNEGKAFVYYGSYTGLSTTANWTCEGNQLNALYGYSVSTAGDVNGDGFSDVIVGASRYDTPIIDEGRAFVYYGSSAGLSPTANWISESHPFAYYSYYGSSVSTAGDVNGDGYSDVIVGAYFYDSGEPDEGKVFAYYGSSSGLPPTASWTAESNQPYARFGNSVSCAGDVNNDGFSDVIIGAYTYDNGETDEGKVFVYYGSFAGLSSAPNWTTESNQANSLFGISVSSAGDVNGDGYSDVIVGAYLYDNGQSNEGAAFVYHGGASVPMSLNLTTCIQGFYNTNSNIIIQDTVKVYLRNISAPYLTVDSAKAYLNAAGKGTFLFTRASNGISYFLQMKHRNSIETWSATGQSFISNLLNFNFTTVRTIAFGSNMIQVDTSPIKFAIYGGDINQDGTIDLTDIILILNDAKIFRSGYVVTDITGDNFVDLSDLMEGFNNSTAFVSKVTP